MPSSTPCQSEPWTAERAVDFAEKTIELVRATRNRLRKDAPHIAVLLLEGGGTDAAMLRQGDPADRARAVQERVTELNAIGGEFGVRFVFSIFEGWLKLAHSPEEMARTLSARAAGMSIREMDGRQEVLMALLDGPGARRAWTAEILADGTVAPAVAMPAEVQMQGRQVGLSGRGGEN